MAQVFASRASATRGRPVFQVPPDVLTHPRNAAVQRDLFEKSNPSRHPNAVNTPPPGSACQYDLFGGCVVIDLPNQKRVKLDVPANELPFAEEGVKKAYMASFAIQSKEGLGTGIAVSSTQQPDGTYATLILTNRHVVQNGDGSIEKKFLATSLWDGATLQGQVMNVLPAQKQDMALLVIQTSAPMATLPLANSKGVGFGQPVYAIGNPLGFMGAVTKGVISHPHRLDQNGNRVVQFDAPISPGNSGGPLITQDGFLIAINTYTIDSRRVPAQNLNFAYPADEGLGELLKSMGAPMAGRETMPAVQQRAA